MDKLVVIVTTTGRFDGREDICRVGIAAVPPNRQAADLVEYLADYPEPLAWAIAAQLARERGLPVAGPNGIAWP